MTETVPETDDLIARMTGRAAFCRDRGEVKTPLLLTQAATALEAAQARIQALEDTLNIERALSDGAHRRARAARREALEEAANLMDDIVYEIGARPMSSIHSALCEYRKRIRALMENPNES